MHGHANIKYNCISEYLRILLDLFHIRVFQYMEVNNVICINAQQQRQSFVTKTP